EYLWPEYVRVALDRLPELDRHILWPQVLPDLPAERIVRPVALRRDTEHLPVLPVTAPDDAALACPLLRQDAPGEVVLVPSGLDQHNPRAGELAARHDRVAVLIVRRLPDRLGVRLLAIGDRVVDHDAIRPQARDRSEERRVGKVGGARGQAAH